MTTTQTCLLLLLAMHTCTQFVAVGSHNYFDLVSNKLYWQLLLVHVPDHA